MKSHFLLFGILACCTQAAIADDFLRQLQTAASLQNLAEWGHWGPNPAKYSSWTSLPFQTADGGFDPTTGGGKDAPGAAEKYSAEYLAQNPRLADMAVTALDVLASRSDRIWLMVEAGDVDWANHQNNINNSIGAVMSGDDAFFSVAQRIEKNVGWDKAAVLLTADHGHHLVLEKPEALLGTVGN